MTEDGNDSGFARTLWVLSRPPHKLITAAIVRVEAGLELRVSYGSEPSLLDRDISDDSVALEWRADTLRGVLEANGWKTVAAG